MDGSGDVGPGAIGSGGDPLAAQARECCRPMTDLRIVRSVDLIPTNQAHTHVECRLVLQQ